MPPALGETVTTLVVMAKGSAVLYLPRVVRSPRSRSGGDAGRCCVGARLGGLSVHPWICWVVAMRLSAWARVEKVEYDDAETT